MVGRDGTYPSRVPGLASGSEEVSTFLNQLLHDSPSSCMTSKIKSLPTPWFSLHVGVAGFAHLEGPLENPQMFGLFGNESGSDNLIKIGKSVVASNAVIDSSSSFNFSDPYGYLQAEVKDVADNEFFATGVEDSDADTSLKENRIWLENNSSDFISRVENKEGSELPSKQVPPRSSSKRSRSADVHNMSEKRRRRRINEKIKALQNLIPNSNKTDKASMLDDAIEYLKQLQLQVQMLTMRNGLSLHPMSLPGTLQPMMSPQIELSLYDSNGTQKLSNGIASSVNAETLVQPSFIKHSTSPNQSAVLPLVSNIMTSGYSQ